MFTWIRPTTIRHNAIVLILNKKSLIVVNVRADGLVKRCLIISKVYTHEYPNDTTNKNNANTCKTAILLVPLLNVV